MDESERAALVRQAVNGDGDALQRLIIHYHGPLHGTIEGRLEDDLRRYVDPDDILQQAYVKAFKSIRECVFDGPGGFYKWLERIALDRLRNAGRDLRRHKRDVRRNLSGAPDGSASYPDLVERLTSAGTTPSGPLARREAAAAVISSLARLTDAQRDVIRMRFLEDRPVAEIAATLGKTEAAIYRLCSRGLDALQKMLGSITGYLVKR